MLCMKDRQQHRPTVTRSKSYRREDLPRKGMGSACAPLEGGCRTGSLAAHPGGIQQRHGKSEEKKESMWAITQIPGTS